MMPDTNAKIPAIAPDAAPPNHACDEATEPVIDASARPFMTRRIMSVLKRLLPVMNQAAADAAVQVLETEIHGYVDPEDGSRELVITQRVRLGADAAMQYWDRLGAAVQHWASSLTDSRAATLVDQIAIEVRWEQNDTTAAGI
jgi:hypothetical protein